MPVRIMVVTVFMWGGCSGGSGVATTDASVSKTYADSRVFSDAADDSAIAATDGPEKRPDSHTARPPRVLVAIPSDYTASMVNYRLYHVPIDGQGPAQPRAVPGHPDASPGYAYTRLQAGDTYPAPFSPFSPILLSG